MCVLNSVVVCLFLLLLLLLFGCFLQFQDVLSLILNVVLTFKLKSRFYYSWKTQ